MGQVIRIPYRTAATGLIGAAVLLVTAGCASSASTTAARTNHAQPTSPASASHPTTPEGAVIAWFDAINRKDKAAAVAAFVPSAAGMMNWGNGDTSTWTTFSALRCAPQTQTATTAAVYCTFKESQAPSVGNPDSFWTVHLQKQPTGDWLIDNYGNA